MHDVLEVSAELGIGALRAMAHGESLVLEGRTYAMVEDCDIVQIASSDHGKTYNLRVDLTVGQWIRYIDKLSDSAKLDLIFQIGKSA